MLTHHSALAQYSSIQLTRSRFSNHRRIRSNLDRFISSDRPRNQDNLGRVAAYSRPQRLERRNRNRHSRSPTRCSKFTKKILTLSCVTTEKTRTYPPFRVANPMVALSVTDARFWNCAGDGAAHTALAPNTTSVYANEINLIVNFASTVHLGNNAYLYVGNWVERPASPAGCWRAKTFEWPRWISCFMRGYHRSVQCLRRVIKWSLGDGLRQVLRF